MGIGEQRWNALCAALGIPPSHDEYARLQSAYREPHRAYHTLQHLSECMEKLDWAKSQRHWENAALAEAALWYHDAIYRPRASDNEINSAEWAFSFLRKGGLSAGDCQFVHSLIMATCHGQKPKEFLHQLVVDVDLGILGAESSRFEQYEQQVRKEYAWVPWFLYRKKRKALLLQFLQAPRIYNTALFYDRYEHRARENMAQSVAKLG